MTDTETDVPRETLSEPDVPDPRPEWVQHPPADQVIVSHIPVSDPAGHVIQMGFYNASGERVR